MRAAIYLRVSTERQDEANQEPDTTRLCAARGWEAEIHRERESGAKRRPEWEAVCEAARTGRVGAVVFWSIDRIGRTRVQAAHDLRELFRWRVTVVSAKERWLDCPPDQGPMRALLIDVVTWFAEEERRKLIERTHAGLDRARAAGRALGRPRAAIAADAVHHGLLLRQRGLSWRHIARELRFLRMGDHQPATLRRAILAACKMGPPDIGA